MSVRVGLESWRVRRMEGDWMRWKAVNGGRLDEVEGDE